MADRLGDFAHNWPMPIFLWLRLITGQRLMQIHRRHLGTALHQTARYPLRAWLTALVAVTLLGLLTGIQLMAAPIKAKQAVKVVIGKHPPKDRRVASEAELIIKNWYPVLAGWLGKKVDQAVKVRVEFINGPKRDIAWDSGNNITINLAKTLQGSNGRRSRSSHGRA